MLKRISELLDKGKSFAFETTLSGKSHRNTVCRAKDRGYTVSLLFFWLKTVDMAKQRVQMRVMRGGHDIADDVIERRYIRGIRYLFDIYMPIADIVMIFDNSDDKQELIAEKRKGTEILVIKDELKFNEIKNIMETQNEDVAKTAEIEEYEIFKKKILEGLELSFRRLLAEKKRNNEELVIMRGDEIVRVKPEELENIYQIN
jgi:predicted ABC-type ATPase